jgi:protein FAM32A
MNAKKPTVIGGKLKLKGSSTSNSTTTPKADLKSSQKRTSDSIEIDEGKGNADVVKDDEIHLTEAQKRFKKQKMEKEKRDAEKLAQKSFRDRIDEFNQKLSKLTEHNDIPRVSAAGNG